MATVFTRIINREVKANIICESRDYIAFLDINPKARGHTLVVPKVEVDYIFDLEERYFSNMFLFARKVAAAIKKAMGCRRIMLLVEGFEIPHAHIHLVPAESAGTLSATQKLYPSPKELEVITNKIKTIYEDG